MLTFVLRTKCLKILGVALEFQDMGQVQYNFQKTLESMYTFPHM